MPSVNGCGLTGYRDTHAGLWESPDGPQRPAVAQRRVQPGGCCGFPCSGQPEGLGEAMWFTVALQGPLPPMTSDSHLRPHAPNCHLHMGLVVRLSFRLLAILSVQLLEFLF